MKYFVAIALIATMASAKILLPNLPAVASDQLAEVQAIIEAIQNPSTDPATAIALEQMLMEVYGFHPIAVGPAIVPPAVDPVIVVDQPSPVTSVEPSPDSVAPIRPTPIATDISSAPLVQIILNINQAESAAAVSPVVPNPVYEAPIRPTPGYEAPVRPTPIPTPTPVIIAPSPVADVEPVIVGTPVFPVIPDPVVLPAPVLPELVPEPVVLPAPELPEVVAPEPVVVVPEPIVIPEPVVIPSPAINLPEILN